ncbi:uncharacterized protein LOC142344743 [Convolutriloba macropyga]|uniref:uncharacterized protein LOC142344743 n=1 Tax=Convolutriloba macropyga TaxID=536237 RepID=UPI003F51FAB6
MRLRNWGVVSLLTYSSLFCKVTRLLGSVVALGAQNEMVILTIDRFLAIRNPAKYQQQLMYNGKFPSRCTKLNYVITLIVCLPNLFVFEIDEKWGRCLMDSSIDPRFGQIYFFLMVTVMYFVIPLLSLLAMNIYITYKIRKSRKDLRSMGINWPNTEDEEAWVTKCSVITTITFFLFTSMGSILGIFSLGIIANIQKGELNEHNFALADLFRSLALLCTTLNMPIALVCFFIQSKELRLFVREIFMILLFNESSEDRKAKNDNIAEQCVDQGDPKQSPILSQLPQLETARISQPKTTSLFSRVLRRHPTKKARHFLVTDVTKR